MAGIGFTLKKLFEDESYTANIKGYLYSGLVSAGPWLSSVITVNILMHIAENNFVEIAQKNLFMGTIVYSFIFSQIVTSPFQLVITRYISDKMYVNDYKSIRASLSGMSKLVFIISYLISVAFYWNKPLEPIYKLMAISLFVIISLLWMVMVYLSAVKNYEIISKGYIIGSIVSIATALLVIRHPIFIFKKDVLASGVLFSYLLGVSITYGILLESFFEAFRESNGLKYDFLRYLNKFPSLFFIGLSYTMALWVDNIIIWFSDISQVIYSTYRFAPFYDNAVFLSYLTIIPTMIMFLVSVETRFYEKYKNFYGLVNTNGTYDEIQASKYEMEDRVYKELLYIMETQAGISILIILLSQAFFYRMGYPIIVRDIFKITALGCLCNIIILIIGLILLYFEGRRSALLINLMFFFTNASFNLYLINRREELYGVGFFLSTFITLIVSILIFRRFIKKIDYYTFSKEDLFEAKERGIFVNMADYLNERVRNRVES